MSDLPIKNKLNKWQEFRIKLYLSLRYSEFLYGISPDYIKQDDRVIKKRINEGNLSQKKLVELFKSKPDLFDEQIGTNLVRKVIADFIEEAFDSQVEDLEIIKNLSTKEQYKIIIKNKGYRKDLIKYVNAEVAQKLINENQFSDKLVFIKECNKDVQYELVKQNENLLKEACYEVQLKYLNNNNNIIELVDEKVKQDFLEENIDFLSNNTKYVKDSSKNTQLLFASQNKENLKYIEPKYQLELINQYPASFEYIDDTFKNSLFYNIDDFSIIEKLLDYNPEYFKYIGYDKNEKIVYKYLEQLQKNVSNLDNNKLKEIIVKRGILSAKGNLRTQSSSYFYGMEDVTGKDIYSKEQLDFIHSLNNNQICELIKIDSNFIMPYVTDLNRCNKITEQNKEIYIKNIEEYKEKCKNVFWELYGYKKFKELEECIDNVFNAQIDFQENPKDRDLDGRNFLQFNIPLESLKLLFNKKIIESNSSKLIKEYYSNLFVQTEGKDEFKAIIKNTYGTKAEKILNERKKLNVYNINSLEIFDERILENFSEEFVHDLISYNIRDFSTFLNIVKNKTDLEDFKIYYNLLSEVTGKNVETMQKSISEFYYNQELIKNISNIELTEKRKINLASVLCGSKNYFSINTVEQLDKFDEIIDKYLEEKINHGENDIDSFVFKNIFGIEKCDVENTEYLFDLETIKEVMIDDEVKSITLITKILNNSTNLKEIANQIHQNPEIKNPIFVYSAMNKIKENNIKFLNNRLLSKDKLDEICTDENFNEKIKKETKDGVDIYYFEGLRLSELELGFIAHDTTWANGRNFMEAEGQSGMSTVSSRFFMDDLFLIKSKPKFLFTNIESEDLLSYENQDANVSHVPKIVKATSKKLRRYWNYKTYA